MTSRNEFLMKPMVTPAELEKWLLAEGLAEEERGYGHVDGAALAVAILGKFRVEHRV